MTEAHTIVKQLLESIKNNAPDNVMIQSINIVDGLDIQRLTGSIKNIEGKSIKQALAMFCQEGQLKDINDYLALMTVVSLYLKNIYNENKNKGLSNLWNIILSQLQDVELLQQIRNLLKLLKTLQDICVNIQQQIIPTFSNNDDIKQQEEEKKESPKQQEQQQQQEEEEQTGFGLTNLFNKSSSLGTLANIIVDKASKSIQNLQTKGDEKINQAINNLGLGSDKKGNGLFDKGQFANSFRGVLIDAIKNSGLNFDVAKVVEMLFNKAGEKLGGSLQTDKQLKLQKKILNKVLGDIQKKINKNQQIRELIQDSIEA